MSDAPVSSNQEVSELVRLLYQRHQDMGDTLARKAAWEIERLRAVVLSAVTTLRAPGVMDRWNCEKLALELEKAAHE